nr:PREDICTED: uncharacterized protein LOC105675109 isoform X3 [Linepithema humile]
MDGESSCAFSRSSTPCIQFFAPYPFRNERCVCLYDDITEPNVGGSEMASREKKPLAPSKSKQKASSDSGLPSNEVKNKKGKSLPNIKQQQVAQEIFDTVATGSQLSAKLEASLPRRNALKNLKRKQNLRAAKANLIKSKVTKKVTNKDLYRVACGVIRGVKAKKAKQSEESTVKAVDITLRLAENQTNNGDNEGKGTETPSKSAKNNLRTKKTKSDIQNKEEASASSSAKVSPKLGRKGKVADSPDSLKSAKTVKLTNLKKNSIKDNLIKVTEGDNKGAKSRKSTGKELDCGSSVKSNSSVEKLPKAALDNKSSIDLTIDEVIACSMLSDTEAEGVTDKTEGKVTRSKKMLVDENTVGDVEIKKEPDTDDMKIPSDGEYTETDQGLHMQNAIQLRKRRKIIDYAYDQPPQRRRNGKQRQLSDSDPGCNESQSIVASSKREICLMKNEMPKNFEEDAETGLEVENNNNSDRVDRTAEIGPTLRSKTKAKIAETEATKDDDAKVEDARVTPKPAEAPAEDSKKLNLDPVRKDSILVKIADKSKGRRSSLNIDTKKTVNSFYNTDKSDGNSKSQIDQMIESIKLNIAKSIEKKIFGPEKSLGLSKNFDAKIEEIVAPLSTESQKMGLEENTDEDRSTVTKNEITSDNSENSVPKVADTAKEIEEKLVKFDIGEAETHSQSIQENKASNSDRINDVHNTNESTCNLDNNNGTSCNNVDEPGVENVGCSTASSASITSSDNESKTSDESRKSVPTRKSSRISDKSSDSGSSPEARKSNRTPNKAVKSDNAEDVAADAQKSTNEETISEDTTSRQISDNAASPASMTSEQIEERFLEDCKQAKETEEPDADILNAVSDNLEESETLESISREVERLVAGEQCVKPLATSDTSLSKEMISDILDKEQEDEDVNEEEASAGCIDNSTPSAANSTNGTNNSHVDSKIVEASETLRENEAPCRSAQSAKHFKPNNNHSPTTANCDSNSEYSSVNSVPTHTCTSDRRNDEAEKLDQDDDCKELNKSSDTSNSDESASNQQSEHNEVAPTTDQSNKATDDKSADEQKPVNEENRRVLRARDKQKKMENKQNTPRSRDHADSAKIKTEESNPQKAQNSNLRSDADESSSVDGTIVPESSQKAEDTSDSQHSNELDANELEPQARTRRSREIKKRKEELPQLSSSSKTKRVKRDLRKSDQQNKEETLLDNEVAKINENNRSFLSKYGSTGVERTESFREFFEQGGQGELDKIEKNSNLRSKSENDIRIVGGKNGKNEERQLSRNLSENHVSKQATDNMDILESECKTLKTPELAQKDSDEASTSGESSSNSGTPKILETPEDKERKESILRLLGLEPLEEATQRLQNQQKTKREQSSSSGTLKTVIRVSQKDKDKDKKGSRSPLKMVLKQQGRGDGEGDSPEFYTIQKEFGTSGLGDSSSGANRKFTTNHRHSCDDDNEEATPKDRQSLVIPEKSSSFSIHPGRVCADVCCYCFGKFGSLDTPMHLAQMKSDERRKKILNVERHLNKDSCLCDACYRHVDRKANTSPTNMQQKPQKQHRQLMISKCSARECRDPARHHVKRRWLLKIRPGLQNQVDIDWESTQHTTMSFCISHYEKIGRFLTCALCKRRLARAHTHQVVSAEIDELNQILGQQGVPVSLAAGTFVCKLCRYFTQLQLKYKDIENMNSNHKSFCKSYRRRILHYLGIEVADDEDDDSPQQASQVKDKKSKKGPKSAQQLKSGSSKSPDRTTSGTSEKSTPEPNKNEGTAGCSSSDIGNETRAIKTGNMSGGENGSTDAHYLGIESAVENLKKRKMLDLYTTSSSCDSAIANEMVEILGMDNEITLTRLPKKPKVNSSNSNDITPVVQRLGANPSISVRTLFPGEEEMNLHVNVEFQNVREVTPQGWEKCATMIQYDRETKLLWQQLQRPYGNQSSFLRHLILLEKYYRAGDLILAPNASRNAINYSTSVQNRLISYEGPEKMDEPIMEPIAAEYNNSRRLSGGYVLEKERLPGTSSMSRPSTSGSSIGAMPSHSVNAKVNAQQRVLKLNSGVSIIKKPPPNLQRLNLPTSSGAKRKDGQNLPPVFAGKVFQMNEPEMLRTQKRQKLNDRQSGAGTSNGSVGGTSGGFRTQYQKTAVAIAGHNQQFHKHLRMQQEMLSRQSRSDFEPLICDITRTTVANENSTTNLIQNFNLPKSIQVTTKPTSSTSNPIPILPKIPKSLTVIPQTITRPADK